MTLDRAQKRRGSCLGTQEGKVNGARPARYSHWIFGYDFES